MFRLLATTKCKRQQIAILIISFFAYVAGIRNEGNNMLLQQKQQQQTSIENSNYQSPMTDIQQPTTSNFRPSPIIDFTPADAAVPQNFKPSYIEPQHSIANVIATYSNSNNNNNNIPQKQETQNDNRRYTFETTAMATYGNVGEKQFSFPNEQQQIPQHLTDKPIYIYRDPYTNENYHYTPTEPNVPTTTSTYSHNNYYNNNGYKQHDTPPHQHHHSNNDDNQEYLVQSSMIVGSHQQQQQQPNPFRPYMSLSDDKDVYLKRPGFVYDEKPSYNHPNSVVIDKKSEETQTLKANKISYDSHDYPPPSYYQQQTSNFLPTPVPTTVRPTVPPTPPPPPPPKPEYRPPTTTQSSIFGQQQPQLQYLQSSQPSSLPNYANNIDNYLLNKQQPNDYYRREVPPPSYFQQYQQQQQQPQYETRPPYEYDARPQYSPPPPSSSYQQHSQPQYVSRPPSSYNPAQSHYPQYETSRPPPPPPGRPSYNNYYDYQIGEIPPPASQQQFNYPYPRPPNSQYPYQGPYRPPHLPPPAQQQQSGLASLVQYAPQFTSLLLSGVGGGGGGSNTNSPLGSLIGALTGATTSQQSSSPSSSYNRRPVNSQLIKALENIARNDDLQCVPKVLCQMIASQTQRGQLPTFITSPAITNFLAGFPAASPALIYGRAALLGLSGGEKSCHQTYVKCPKDEYEIIYYLNNHRGGFFKFFSEPDEQQQSVNHDSTQQGATSLFSILAALAGTPQATTTTPRPTPKPQAPSTDITSGIGNFFTQLLSDYMGGATVEYQRRFKRRTKRSLNDKIKFEDESQETNRDIIKFEDESREHHSDVLKFRDEDYDINEEKNQDTEEDFHDEEDDEDTQQGVEFKDEEDDYLDDTEGRIIHKSGGRGKRVKFFPEIRETSDEIDKEEEIKKLIKKFNDFNRERKLKFPTATDERLYVDADNHGLRKGKLLKDNNLSYEQQTYGPQFNNYVENSYENFQKESKKIKFIDDDPSDNDNEEQAQSLYSYYLQTPKETKTKLVFPQREGKILNRPYYAASYLQDYLQQQHLEQEEDAAQDDKFVVSNSQRPLRYTEFPSAPSSANIYNTHINSLHSQNSFTSNAAVNNNIYVASPPTNTNSNSNHFLPTPAPPDNDFTAANSIYSSNDYSDNQYNYNSLKQTTYYKPQRYPSTSSTSPWPSYSGGSNNFYKPQRYPTSNSQMNYNRYHSSLYTTRRPYVSVTTTRKSNDDKNIYVTNSRGVTEYYITPDGRKVYL